MNNEEMITEASLIPQNFSWRAGIGTNASATSVQPTNSEVEMQRNRTNVQFAQSLLAEIDTNLTDICDKHKNDEPNVNTYNKVKSEMRQWFMNAYKKYKDNIGADFMQLLYNTCLQSYVNQWVIICGNVGVKDVSSTEYVFSNRGIEINPFVAYQLMDSVTKQYGINEDNTMIINE